MLPTPLEPLADTEQRAGRILRTGAALLSVQGITWISSLVGILIIPRYLGPRDFGISSAAITMVLLGTLAAAFGTTNLLVKETARNPAEGRNLVLHATGLRVLLWAGFCAVALPLIFIVSDSSTIQIVFLISAMGGFLSLVVEAQLAGLQGVQRLGRIALLTSLAIIVGQGILVVVLVLGGDVVAMTVSAFFMAALVMILSSWTFLTTMKGEVRPALTTLKFLAKAGPPYLAWDLGQKLYSAIDILILSLLVGSTAVGSYAFAYRLATIPVFATTIITMSVYPSLSAAALKDEQWFRRVVTNGARLALLITVPMAVGIGLLADPLVALLSGGGFGDSPVVVIVLAIHIPFAAIHTVLGMSLFAKDRQKRMAFVAWGAVAFNVVGNLIAIPFAERLWGNGAIGAALATVATEGMVGCFVWRWGWANIEARGLFESIGRVLAAAGVMGISVVVVYPLWGLYGAIPIGAITYLAAAVAFGTFSREEMGNLTKELLGPRSPESVKA